MQELDTYAKILIAVSFFILIAFTVIGVFFLQLAREKKLLLKLKTREFEEVEREKLRIANDIHDEANSYIFMLKHALENATIDIKDAQVKSQITSTSEKLMGFIDLLRSSVENIYPKELMENRWEEAIYELSKRFNSKNVKISCDINVHDKLSQRQAVHSYRVIQELLSNIIKHREVPFIALNIDQIGKTVHVEFRYNRNDEKSKFGKRNRGIATIKHRLDILGGKYSRHTGDDDDNILVESIIFDL